MIDGTSLDLIFESKNGMKETFFKGSLTLTIATLTKFYLLHIN